MLFDTFSHKEFKKTPYPETFRLLNKMSEVQLSAARDALNDMIEGDEIHTAGWMPGSDWTGTPFQPIYEIAANRDYSMAAKLFGLLVFETFMNRDEKWYTLRAEKDGYPIGSRTYFKAKD